MAQTVSGSGGGGSQPSPQSWQAMQQRFGQAWNWLAQNDPYSAAAILSGSQPVPKSLPSPPIDISQRQTERTMPSGLPAPNKSSTGGTDTGIPGNPNAGSSNSTNYSLGGGGVSADTAANLAEKQREFDITTARDLAKQQGQEVDALQQRLASLSGPKDAYADYFFAHGLLPPQGYKPAPVPLTQAQIDAYGRMGVTPQQLQGMISGTGQPGANFNSLGNLGSSLQTPTGLPPLQQGQGPTGAQAPANPTMQGGALYGQNPTVPGMGGTPNVITPGGVPKMDTGGQVPGPPGTPTLAVLHGGEQVQPAPGTSSGSPMNPGQDVNSAQPPTTPGQGGNILNQPGLHPAIAALVDAVSNLLSSPDFAPFVQAAQATNRATPGGVQSMAQGGIVQQGGLGGSLTSSQISTEQATGRDPMTSNVQGGLLQSSPLRSVDLPPTSSFGGAPPQLGQAKGIPAMATSGQPLAGAQQVISNTGAVAKDNPIMPVANMDPYTRALYDMNGRLHPYSAQQQAQGGPALMDSVSSYVSKVQGGDIKQYQDLVDRLKPLGAAPTASTGTASEGFSFG